MAAIETDIIALERHQEEQQTQKPSDLLSLLTELDDTAAPSDIEAALRGIGAGLGGTDKLGRMTLRSQIIDELERRKVRGPAAMADAALATGGNESKGGVQGTEIALTDPEPWPDAVDGAGLLNEIAAIFKRFLALPNGAVEALSLWVLHAYVYMAFLITPRLAFTSATKRCGKTTAQTLTGALVPRPLTTANITTAALFRAVEAYAPTILIDEADMFLEAREELRGVLNAGHFRPTAHVIRTAGDDHEVRLFSVWAPASVALIGKLPGTLADRSIEIQMRRKTADEVVERLRMDRLDEFENVRRKAVRWAQDNIEALRDADPDTPDELHDRAADNWRPLLAIADLAGGDWPEEARVAALTLSGVAEESGDGDIGPELLADVYTIFKKRGTETLASSVLVEALIGKADRPWATWRRGNALTQHQLARLLQPFDIRPKSLRIGERVLRGYEREQFIDAWRRYPPVPQDRDTKPLQPLQPHNHAEKRTFPKRYEGHAVADTETGANPHGDGIVAGVALQDPTSSKEDEVPW